MAEWEWRVVCLEKEIEDLRAENEELKRCNALAYETAKTAVFDRDQAMSGKCDCIHAVACDNFISASEYTEYGAYNVCYNCDHLRKCHKEEKK